MHPPDAVQVRRILFSQGLPADSPCHLPHLIAFNALGKRLVVEGRSQHDSKDDGQNLPAAVDPGGREQEV